MSKRIDHDPGYCGYCEVLYSDPTVTGRHREGCPNAQFGTSDVTADPVVCPDCNLDAGLLCGKHYDMRIVRTETVHDSWCRVTAANRLGDAWCDCSAKERRTLGEQLRATGHVDTRAEPSFATCTLESCAPECVRGELPCPFAQERGRKQEPRFCGYSVCGDRGGQAEACGKELPCEEHPTTRRAYTVKCVNCDRYML